MRIVITAVVVNCKTMRRVGQITNKKKTLGLGAKVLTKGQIDEAYINTTTTTTATA